MFNDIDFEFRYACELQDRYNELVMIWYKLTFLRDCGYDVEKGINYIEFKMNEISLLKVDLHKHRYIRLGQLPPYCIRKCDFNCCECELRREESV